MTFISEVNQYWQIIVGYKNHVRLTVPVPIKKATRSAKVIPNIPATLVGLICHHIIRPDIPQKTNIRPVISTKRLHIHLVFTESG